MESDHTNNDLGDSSSPQHKNSNIADRRLISHGVNSPSSSERKQVSFSSATISKDPKSTVTSRTMSVRDVECQLPPQSTTLRDGKPFLVNTTSNLVDPQTIHASVKPVRTHMMQNIEPDVDVGMWNHIEVQLVVKL